MIVKVDDSTMLSAAQIHSEAWKESHRAFCSEKFVEQHTIENQEKYLHKEISEGKDLYILIEQKPVGIVSIKDDLIENLYVLPSEQHKGYGTQLLIFAIQQCNGPPCLWILNNNEKAYSLYAKHGFALTGNTHRLSDTISEIEMKRHCEQKKFRY